MKQSIKRFLALLCIALLLPCLTVGVLAAGYADESDPDDANGPYYDRNGYVVWEYDETTDTIYGMGKEYQYYVPSMNVRLQSAVRYQFANKIVLNYDEDRLYSYSDNPEVLLSFYSQDIFVTEAGRISLEALQNGNAVTYVLQTAYGVYSTETLDNAFVEDMRDTQDKKTLDVRTLSNGLVCEVAGYDGTNSFACAYGGVYQLDGEYYYIRYIELGNQYFDADGNFSYRSGTVDAYVMDRDQISSVQLMMNDMEYTGGYNMIYEEDRDTEINEDGAIVLFVIFAVLLGFIAPLPLLVIGICMARSVKRGRPTYWYGLSIVAAAWMVVTLILLIVLL